MEVIQAMMSRRSVRRFQNKPVDQADVETILRAGMQAPSANNGQPWRFIVIDKREVLDSIPKIHPYARMMNEAQLGFLVCAQVPPETSLDRWVQDCSAATENMLLAIHGLGLGAVWLGVYPRPDRISAVTQLFGLPDDIKPMALIAVGHPAEHPEPADRYDPKKVRYNHW
ncbi:MAG: nitroreductase family protein [Anaerolineaceae bacterium]